MERLHPDVVGGLQGRGAENGERLRFHAEHQDRPRLAQCSNRFRTLRHGQIKNDDITAPHGFRRKTPVTRNLMLKPFQRSDVPYVCQKQRILAENPDVELTPVHVLSP